MSKDPGDPVPPSALPKKSGVLVYHAQWSDATGHFDLWTGSGFVGAGNFDGIKQAFDLEFRELA